MESLQSQSLNQKAGNVSGTNGSSQEQQFEIKGIEGEIQLQDHFDKVFHIEKRASQLKRNLAGAMALVAMRRRTRALAPAMMASDNEGSSSPSGRVFTPEEIERMSKILEKWPQVTVLNDEVYFHLPFDGRKITSFANYS